jgi:hypothetical protein
MERWRSDGVRNKALKMPVGEKVIIPEMMLDMRANIELPEQD